MLDVIVVALVVCLFAFIWWHDRQLEKRWQRMVDDAQKPANWGEAEEWARLRQR